MTKKNKQNAQSFGDNKQAEQADKTMNVTGADILSKQQELKELEDSLNQKETVIAQKEKELKIAKDAIAQKEAELNDKRVRLEEMEFQAKNGFPQLFEEKFAYIKKQLEERENKITEKWKKIEAEKEKLRQRELSIQKAEIQRENGYQDERKKLDEEIAEKRRNCLGELEEEIKKEREKRLSLLSDEIDEKRKDFENKVRDQKNEFLKKEKELKQRELDVEDLEIEKDKAKRKRERLDEELANLNDKVDKLMEVEREEYRKNLEKKDKEIKKYIEESASLQELLNTYKKLEHDLGEDPQMVKDNLAQQVETIKSLQGDLANRPLVKQEELDRLKDEKGSIEQELNRYKEDYNKLLKTRQEQSELESMIDFLEQKNKILTEQRENIEAHNTQLQADLKRLQASYEREQDREARIRDIETPYIQKELPPAVDKVEELQWLDSISKSCIDYGLRFPRRILHAFHTALKTSEWSPITVLAGVSGTGKSELPRLYSHFGGINFLSLSVQPNWDSQESMLGFFNSIDNKFDAQPVLRLLAQSQKAKNKDYPFGLEDVMSLILMDEMNLAHVELYFAEFLSKLELRRGRKGNEVPSLEVKLGAGIQHYNLPLGRNVLWAGTMNQDETTKSLSDKVLDRGIVINFPRPTTLERRRQLKQLGNQAPLLSRKLWESWWSRESKFNDDQILPFKGFIEEMNTSLSKVGRALGHRVWQSIEYYMSNYPDVLEAQRNNDDTGLAKAMKVAFEDQLVQKVMPKLRGIETRGKSKSDCLDKIRKQLVDEDYNIVEDFDLAQEFGYGQFIWNSANYIKDDEAVNVHENAEN